MPRIFANIAYEILIDQGGAFKFKFETWSNITWFVKVKSKGKIALDCYLAVYLDNKVVILVENLLLPKDMYDRAKSQTNADQQVRFIFLSGTCSR